MKFLADENIDRPIVDRLRSDGHSVLYIVEMEPSVSDEQVIQEANRESAMLITSDKDFGELVFRLGHVLAGVILIRLAGLTPQRKADIVSAVIKEHHMELAGNFAVITSGIVRIRRS
ncbi:MAG: DUF5615 family PIN-like protein [Armatimonadetes bacterium]|nr:DUF5615 family PIN-like protein [Armatimonadota bacterium]